jgi:hypothetical protein
MTGLPGIGPRLPMLPGKADDIVGWEPWARHQIGPFAQVRA